MTKLGSCDDLVWQGLKYASDKARKRKERLYNRIKVKDLEDPVIQEGVGQITDNIQTEEKSDKEHFKQLN